jgi:hypothetical protein
VFIRNTYIFSPWTGLAPARALHGDRIRLSVIRSIYLDAPRNDVRTATILEARHRPHGQHGSPMIPLNDVALILPSVIVMAVTRPELWT